MLRGRAWWVFFVLATSVAADTQCRDQSCLGTDDSSLLQKLQQKLRSNPAVPGGDLTKCAEGFACGALGAKVDQKVYIGKLPPVKGLGAMSGRAVVCSAGSPELTKYLASNEVKTTVAKAQPCMKKHMIGLVKHCAEGKASKAKKKYAGAGLPYDEYQQLKDEASFLRKCSNGFSPKGQLNTTILATLYKTCDYPTIAEILIEGEKAEPSHPVPNPCELAGVLVVQLHNVFETRSQAEKDAELDDLKADKALGETKEAADKVGEKVMKKFEDSTKDEDDDLVVHGPEGDHEEGSEESHGVLDDIEDMFDDVASDAVDVIPDAIA